MLNFSDISLLRGARPLFTGASLIIHAGRKVGITGANGAGKSSLLALVRGELHPDTGEFQCPPRLRIAHVAQETPALERAALDYVLDGDEELRAVEAALAESGTDGARVAELHARLEAIDGYTAPARAARLMQGLGFTPGEERHAVSAFSGGWRMRLNLARALMCRSDLLLLDEPTNHLDLDAVIWLQDWLRGYRGTLLLISHDRDFLDEVTDQILHIEHASLQLYTGNYSAFEAARAERLAQQGAAHARQQREIAHMQRFVERFRAKATKARQAQSRLKALERMTRIAPAHVDSPFHFDFQAPRKLPDPLLRLEDAAVGYGATPLLRGVNLSLSPGARIALLGPNGAGKSTLIKLIAGALEAQGGEGFRAKDLVIGYFAQHQLESLHPGESPADHLLRQERGLSDQAVRDFLGGFGFSGDKIFEPVEQFSGGERARLALALIVHQRPNLLLLDEPTNHLDLEMRHALALALQGYEGAMIVVSHDRHLLRAVADAFWLVEDGGLRPFDGDLNDYRNYLAERGRDAQKSEPTGAPERLNRKAQRQVEAQKRQQTQPLRKELRELEARMEALGAQQSQMEARLADTTLYQDEHRQALAELLKEKGAVDQALAETEEAWLRVSEALEQVS